MIFRKFDPHPLLTDFVLFYFELDWKAESPGGAINYLSIPTGCSFIGFQKKGRLKVKMEEIVYHTEKYYVNAQTTVPYQMYSTDSQLNILVACLKPTALYHLFQTDVSKMVNTGADPTALFQGGLDSFSIAFHQNNNVEERIGLLNTILLAQLHRVTPAFNFIDTAIELILQAEGNIGVETLTHKLHVSKRYFQKKFSEIVGIPPLQYIKLIRYNFIFSSFKQRDAQYNSSDAMLYFYDSAHYSKSFKDFMGMPPTEFDVARYPFVQLTAVEQAVWINSFQALSS